MNILKNALLTPLLMTPVSNEMMNLCGGF
ncbi:hypothetical protein KL86PLE_41237 [uncultured Pleomorphomonas sp.]|uniref:Uncharacterized protein n=1 Tax=uncultured Pleomorphomonas sp. TaxID=442121 RepID=A0A212LIR0_9HYPH|nr:hypothetical protein KL86PLE_41237 [uncultured Pleomorphomonas sp.]